MVQHVDRIPDGTHRSQLIRRRLHVDAFGQQVGRREKFAEGGDANSSADVAFAERVDRDDFAFRIDQRPAGITGLQEKIAEHDRGVNLRENSLSHQKFLIQWRSDCHDRYADFEGVLPIFREYPQGLKALDDLAVHFENRHVVMRVHCCHDGSDFFSVGELDRQIP